MSEDRLILDIKDELERGADASRISRKFDLPYNIVRTLIEKINGDPQSIANKGDPNAYYGGFGRPWMRQYMVSRRHVHGEWPSYDELLIEAARRKYEAGIAELCQGRDGQWIIQYCIPRKHPTRPRPGYFTLLVEDTNV